MAAGDLWLPYWKAQLWLKGQWHLHKESQRHEGPCAQPFHGREPTGYGPSPPTLSPSPPTSPLPELPNLWEDSSGFGRGHPHPETL